MKYMIPVIMVLCHFIVLTVLTARETKDAVSKHLLVDTKCSRCHTLKRVFIMPRPAEAWKNIVEEMRDKNPEWITSEEAQQIISEIVSILPERIRAATSERKDYEDARLLFVDRCTSCHSINRILLKDKTTGEWRETVDRMQSEASEYITKEDASRITQFLSERADVLKEDAGGNIFVAKCLICHPGEQILLETHDRDGWEKIVKKMQVITRDTLPSARFGYEEAKLVVDLLVKTQGPKTNNNSTQP
ncbi:MAG: hypothetical protein DWB56_03070 [Candidatus Jettenia sp.]|uniref:Putative heme protein n=1 Tax=Candidatus Jettenia caeni TaxID=247490 RepID=I3INE2_9BACT|nr:hypothetical protein [Candidatus Jettenia sp. AMX1]MBC6927939.1 hypothetical protein [Candidatus Jettenia sp.]NUN24004.1 hypothetical protein [Candidatus Jettenia caeni]KAA0248258.1 MAG: hypothetical protein EDM77_13200 [Candidatus Jettenia sp. AMX1]MCE7879541.1 hypothetical protein [Candidatus Jettenia sp. AMX1]MDL1937834.1 hypothetical protein [Candidatus Jettenia sp. AMX1]